MAQYYKLAELPRLYTIKAKLAINRSFATLHFSFVPDEKSSLLESSEDIFYPLEFQRLKTSFSLKMISGYFDEVEEKCFKFSNVEYMKID